MIVVASICGPVGAATGGGGGGGGGAALLPQKDMVRIVDVGCTRSARPGITTPRFFQDSTAESRPKEVGVRSYDGSGSNGRVVVGQSRLQEEGGGRDTDPLLLSADRNSRSRPQGFTVGRQEKCSRGTTLLWGLLTIRHRYIRSFAMCCAF